MDRNQAISVSADQISRCSRWIGNHALFSNTEICIKGLEVSGLNLSLIVNYRRVTKVILGECLSFRFLHIETDLERDVRAFG